MLKAIVIVVVLLIVTAGGIAAYAAATQPDSFRVERRTHIGAPPETLVAILTDLRRGVDWSPYESKDPGMTKVFSGPETGVGSKMAWDGNSDVGAGSLTVTDVAASKVTLALAMTRPMTANNVVEYEVTPRDGGTDMVWSMQGSMPLMSKVMCLFVNLDSMLGRDMEQGLARLKTLAES